MTKIPKFELASCPMWDMRTGERLRTRLRGHMFTRWKDGPWANSVICRMCGVTGYSQPDGSFHATEPKKATLSCFGIN